MKAYAASHVGLVRHTNEDAYYLPRPGERFAVVADGMGGHLAGEVASAIAVEEFAGCLRTACRVDEEVLKRAVRMANHAIYRESHHDAAKSGMGTTLTALWFDAGLVYVVHVGDSRAYLLRSGALMQLTRDHSLVEEMLEMGEITQEQARVHPHRNYITRALGTNAHVEPDILRLDFKPEDVWLLCSDGMSNLLRGPEMAEMLMQQQLSWQQRLDRMVELALERGGQDNITALVVTGEETGE